MSTFLELVQALATESGVTSSAQSVTTVVGQTGMPGRFVNWTRRAYNEIQRRHFNWRWLRSEFSVDTVIGTDTYAPTVCTDTLVSGLITRFGQWIPYDDEGAPNIKRFLTATGVAGGEIWMTQLPWPYFQGIYRFGPQVNNPIIHAVIDPRDNLVVGPKPDAVYTIQGEYYKSSQILTNDADVPEMPENFHDLIMYRALQKYARHAAAGEVLAAGQAEASKLLRALEQDQLPELYTARPLC